MSLILGPYLLPSHQSGLLRAVRDKTDSLLAEVLITSESPFIGASLITMLNALGIAASRAIKIRRRQGTGDVEVAAPKDVSSSLFDREYLKRALPFWKPRSAEPTQQPVEEQTFAGDQSPEYADIIAPSPSEFLRVGDVVFISSAQDVVEKMMKSIAGESKGLRILKSDVMALPGFGSELVECVVSDTNPFVGKKVGDISVEFSDAYKASIITARSKCCLYS